jgi:hypothetical protein
MPAKTDIPAKYKSYVGRLFFLRKHKIIPASLDQKAKTRKDYDRIETFGDACLVLDETNTRVKIVAAGNKILWISKFYLHKEVIDKDLEQHDSITALLETLIGFKDSFQELYKKYKPIINGSKKKQQQHEKEGPSEEFFHELIRQLRNYADVLKNQEK